MSNIVISREKIDTSWQKKGACLDTSPSLFYPEQGEAINPIAVKLCKTCPVKQECLEYALKHEQYGYWGGLSEKARKRIRIERGIHLHKPEATIWMENTNLGRKRVYR